MKKALTTIFSLFMVISMTWAQDGDDMVIQPTHVVARRINAEGEVTKEMESNFYYLMNGKLSSFDCPEYALTASFSYSENFLTHEHIFHDGGDHFFTETNLYTYENGLIKTVSHLVSSMGGSDQYWLYSYYDDGRLERKEKRDDDDPNDQDFHNHWLYDYGPDGKTVTESYYTSWVPQGLKLREKTVSQFDDSYKVSSELCEKYELSGEITSTTRTDYVYTPSGKLERKTIQTLHDGSWSNTAVTQFTYDEEDWVVEQLDGSWDDQTNDWNFTSKISFDISGDRQSLSVSFYKKSGDNWIRDIFNRQTILFEPYLKLQQRMLNYLAYDIYNGNGNFNQIEFTLERTNKPTYLSAEKHSEAVINVYPNPGSHILKVETPVENAVIRFYDLQGRMMVARTFDFNMTIDAGPWPSGMYVWEIWSGNQKLSGGKWIKE